MDLNHRLEVCCTSSSRLRKTLLTLMSAWMILLSFSGLAEAQTPPAERKQPAAKQADEEKGGGWRLEDSSSLYLREHAENPVEWFPWSDAAFAQAQELDRPVFLSIGYSSCHWCHVMRRESFSDEEIAAFLNQHFICIKVDREDHPNVDSVYMDAVRAMTGRGGWPLSVFLTPDRLPFFGGTYFPPRSSPGRPGFDSLLKRVEEVWRTERSQILQASNALSTHLAELSTRSGEEVTPTEYIELGVQQAIDRFDSRSGGWRNAPKFPDPRLIDFLLASSKLGGMPIEEQMAVKTLQQMRAGGIYDQVRGGFHRYSVDANWTVPHFEKMLYSQGLLGESYANATRLTGNSEFATTTRELLDNLLRDFLVEGGGFAASFDADSGGEEGTFYVWTPDQINEILGEEDGAILRNYLGITAAGNFEGGRSVPSRRKSVSDIALELQIAPTLVEKTVERGLSKLDAARSKREAPRRDEKVILGWNATAISALARGAVALKEDRYRRAAESALQFTRTRLVNSGDFRRRVTAGEVGDSVALTDAVLYLKSVLDLYEANFDAELLAHSREVETWIEANFGGEDHRGALFESPTGFDLVIPRRPQPFGAALPSSNGTHVRNLLRLHAFTAKAEYLERADSILSACLALTSQAPSAAPELLIAALMRVTGIPEIAIAGDPKLPLTQLLLAPALRFQIPYRIVAHRPPGPAGEQAVEAMPILESRTPIDGRPTAWFCENFICEAPTSDATVLRASLAEFQERASQARAKVRRDSQGTPESPSDQR